MAERRRRAAVVGATGVAGQQFLVSLGQHPWFEVKRLAASERSAGKKFKQHDISKLLLVSRANVTGLVTSLVRKGLAKREPDRDDRRAWLVKITPKGKSLLEAYLPRLYEEIHRSFSGFKPGEKKELNQLIVKLKGGIL